MRRCASSLSLGRDVRRSVLQLISTNLEYAVGVLIPRSSAKRLCSLIQPISAFSSDYRSIRISSPFPFLSWSQDEGTLKLGCT